jgi:hypothetical protein
MEKTYRITAANNNPTGQYEVTFYFTKQEKEGWEAATGQSWNDIKIIKLPSAISSVTPTNAQPDGPGTVQVIDAVKRSFGTGYTLSAIFNNGFSGFGFGIPGRMNEQLVLSGHIDANNVDIDLGWTTVAEINSSQFEVEKSYDGTNFHKIGTVNAAVNKLTPSSYAFVDHENVQQNYYRIKMLHTDGFVLYSNTIYIAKNDAPQRLFIYPNPFGSTLHIRFAKNPEGPVTFSFYDMAGKLVKKYSEPSGLSMYDINTSGIVSRAVYMVKVNVDGQQIVHRVLKE